MKPLWILIVLFLEQLAVARSSAFQDFWAEAQWAEFKALHHKSYRSVEEEAFRRKIFLDNRYTIARHNERYGRGLVSFKLRMNQYGDLRGVCHFRNDSVGATVTGTVTVEKGDERMVEVAVATVGPVSGAVYAKLLSFRFYGGGVYRDDECGLHALTHAVLIVGYGVTDDGTKYWIVKNSWGRGWGEHGYMRLAKDAGNQCRIADLVSFPLV
ncbi:hypothetical protein V5799_016670 [Amblyomma americanum]|uniref:Uncharacterized protein n=1 Tax=Amblyomma americanum TaxID=6943 RepID=A0AAQ4F5I7_AMBAM